MPGGKFCRHCGKPATGHMHGDSVTEATTRTLNPSAPYETPPQYGDVRLTPHAHGQVAHAAHTHALEREPHEGRKMSASKLTLKIVAALLLLPLAAFVAVMVWRGMTRPSRIVVMQRDMPPSQPMPDAHAPHAGIPMPPPPPGISSQLVYPNTETTANFIQPDGGSQLHLRTKDAPAKVADWYAARVKPVQTIQSPDGTIILQFTEGQVIIKPEGASTMILIMHYSG